MDQHLVYGRVTVYATFFDGRVYWYGVEMGGGRFNAANVLQRDRIGGAVLWCGEGFPRMH